MSRFADAQRNLEAERVHRTPRTHPKGWEPGYTWDGSAGVLTTRPLADRPRTWDEFIRDAGLDPDDVEVIEPVNVRGWDANMGRDPASGAVTVHRMHYYRLNLRRRASAELPDLPTVMRAAKAAARRKAKTPPDGPIERAVVAVFADPQTGKVAARGGTEQLVERYAATLERLGNYVADANAEQGVWLDAGDAVESFENNPGEQQTTNDLSLMSQVDAATFLEFEGIDLLCRLLPRVVAAGVGSNHCRWRQGKANMGTPADDWGLHMLRQIHRWTGRLAGEQYAHLSVLVPQRHDETLAIDVAGEIVGLAHGHQVNQPNQIPAWWTGQAHGGQPIADADILVTGHFHHLRVEPVGRNPHKDRARWWLQAPTLDNGSDWFRFRKGYDSDPGMLVFTITRGRGWHSMEIL